MSIILKYKMAGYHFEVVEDSRNLLYSLDNFHRGIRILCLACHFFVQSHLPAHGGIVNLFKTESQRFSTKLFTPADGVFFLLNKEDKNTLP